MKANLNQNTTWECSGTSDFIECFIFSNDQDRAIQLEGIGLNFSTAVVTAYGETGASQVVTFPEGTAEICAVGGDKNFLVARIKVSNVPAGTYTFRASSV